MEECRPGKEYIEPDEFKVSDRVQILYGNMSDLTGTVVSVNLGSSDEILDVYCVRLDGGFTLRYFDRENLIPTEKAEVKNLTPGAVFNGMLGRCGDAVFINSNLLERNELAIQTDFKMIGIAEKVIRLHEEKTAADLEFKVKANLLRDEAIDRLKSLTDEKYVS